MTKIVITEDGSHTLYNADIGEHYHSIHGAIQESKHVFIEAGLSALKNQNISILEIGFGTGLNTFLTIIEAIKKQLTIEYTGVELYPISKEDVYSLNYHSMLNHKDLFYKIHETEWNKKLEITDNYNMQKTKVDILKMELKNKFDLVYFDAFAPKFQPELWSQEVFLKIANQMNTDAILTTYSAQGQVRRNLESVGLSVERIPGPPGKREMLRAIKN